MQEKYQELTLTLSEPYVEFIADLVSTLFDDSLEIGEKHIILRSEEDLAPIMEALKAVIEPLGDSVAIKYRLVEKKNLDWIRQYQASVSPIEAGKFYIRPSWYSAKEGKIDIQIDPALAFGSGHHATTFSCLEAISERVSGNEKIIDVGCGSGILGLACAKLGAMVDLCDTDPLSVKSCQENFSLNQSTYNRLWEGSANQTDTSYDIVIANIITDVLRFISSDLKSILNPGGTLILSGILDTKESQVLPPFKDLTLQNRKQRDEWITLIYTKDNNE